MQNNQIQIETGLGAKIKEAIGSIPSFLWWILIIILAIGLLPIIVSAAAVVVSGCAVAIGALLIPIGVTAGVAGFIKFCLWLVAGIMGLKIFFETKRRRK